MPVDAEASASAGCDDESALEDRIAPIIERGSHRRFPVIKISAGTWVTHLLCGGVKELIGGDRISLRFVAANEVLDIGRREALMGLLTGNYGADKKVSADDIRATTNLVVKYFEGAKANPAYIAQVDAVRELLTTGGRSLVQGAIGWLWARGSMNIPIPGARTALQIEGIAGALAFGALPEHVMAAIERVIERDPTDLEADRER